VAYVGAAVRAVLGYQPARVIGRAVKKLKPGDGMLTEEQSPVCGLEAYGPLE